MVRSVADTSAYNVPALEKGLDILEYLAAQGVPATQAQIARALGRGPNELFRMLVVLERRGYVRRDAVSGAYALTLRLYELSHSHSPYEELLRVAQRPMQTLTETILESCHLSVLQRGALVVLAQEESPSPLRLSVEVGSRFPFIHTASGRLLAAYLTQDERAALLDDDQEWNALPHERQQTLTAHFGIIRERGYEEAWSETNQGIQDYAVLVGAPDGTVKAALAVAALTRPREVPRGDVLVSLHACARQIEDAAGLRHGTTDQL